MRVLVTGSAGFIGSNLVDRLLDLGHEVTGVDCFTPYYDVERKRANMEEALVRGLTFHALDLSRDNLLWLGQGPELIFHCAAQPGIAPETSFDDYVANNIVATRRLVEYATRLPHLKLFVNVGSSSIYGSLATCEETAQPRPASVYGVTKLAAEQLVLAAYRANALPACSMRLFSVYGPRERPDKLIPRLLHAIANDEALPLHADARAHSRSYSYISDVVDAMAAVVTRTDRLGGEILNIGSPLRTYTEEIIEIVEANVGGKVRTVRAPARTGDQLATQANINRARMLLGFKPTVTPDDGIRRTVAWFEGERGSDAVRSDAHRFRGQPHARERKVAPIH